MNTNDTKIIDEDNKCDSGFFNEDKSYENKCDYEYQLIKEGHLSQFLLGHRSNNLSPSLLKQTLTQKVCAWYTTGQEALSENQSKLNKELLSILRNTDEGTNDNGSVDDLEIFLTKNKNDKDLKFILNLKRGESESTVLHAISSSEISEERTGPNNRVIDLLLRSGAKIDVQNNQGDTPLHSAAEARNKRNILLLLKRGADDNICNNQGKAAKELARESYSCDVEHTSLLWNNLIEVERKKLNKFLAQSTNAKNINQLLEIVYDALESGVQLNCKPSQGTNSLTDSVIKRIKDLHSQDIVESKIISLLIARGAVFSNETSINIFDKLELEHENHKSIVKKAYNHYVSNAHKFIEAARNATNERLQDLKIDNSIFYLKYSENSTIEMEKIANGIEGLKIKTGKEKSIIKMGNSEVEVEIVNGMRNYVNLSSGIKLTFPTSKGELNVEMSSDGKQIKVKTSTPELIKELQKSNERIGKDCTIRGLSVVNAIEQGLLKIDEKRGEDSENKWRESIVRNRGLKRTHSLS